MMNNKRGQTLFMSILVAIMIFFAGSMIVQFIKTDVITATGTSGLDCNNLSISDGAKMLCLGLDTVVPYFIIIFCSLAGGLITSRLMVG